jgi:hypothetical protein
VGRHADLLARRGVYSQLYEEQFRPGSVRSLIPGDQNGEAR